MGFAMIEKRHFHRVRLSAASELSGSDINVHGRLENISINGALIRFDQDVVVSSGSEYILTIYPKDDVHLRFRVEVVHANHSLAGVKFVGYDADMLRRLGELVAALTQEPDRLRAEMEDIKGLITDYLDGC